MFIGAIAFLLLGLFTPKTMHLGGNVDLDHSTFFRWGSFFTTFPPLRVVIAKKPL
jgi:hypothetical protein